MPTHSGEKQSGWTDRVADATFNYLGKRHHLGKLTWQEIRDRVLNCEWAATYNKSWGPDSIDGRRLITLKLFCAAYRQSGLNVKCYNYNEKWGTFDRGWFQINDVHTFCAGPGSYWFQFCKLESINPKNPRNLWIPEVNAKFGAYINEQRIKEGTHPYDYYDPGEENEKNGLYECLLKVTGLFPLAKKYNDGQFIGTAVPREGKLSREGKDESVYAGRP